MSRLSGFRNKVSPKLRILVLATSLILIPGGLLTYLGLTSVQKRSQDLRTDLEARLRLLREKLELQISRLQESVQVTVRRAPPEQGDVAVLQHWLGRLTAGNPGLARPFIFGRETGLVSEAAYLGKAGERRRIGEQRPLDLSRAESAEFRGADPSAAIRIYQRLLEKETDPANRALLLSRIGRCRLKAGQHRAGARAYERLLRSCGEASIRIGEVPCQVVALSQLADAYAAVAETGKAVQSWLDLYAWQLDHPWELKPEEMSFYLELSAENAWQAGRDLNPGQGEMSRRLSELNLRRERWSEELAFLKWAEVSLVAGLERDEGRLSGIYRGNVSSFYYFGLPGNRRGLAYSLDPQALFETFLSRLSEEGGMPSGLAPVLLDETDEVRAGEAGPRRSALLVSLNLGASLPFWKIALFDREGKSIEDMLRREKLAYLAFAVGIVLVMAIGITLTVRAAAKETELSRLRSEFVSSVSHELKTPLALIRMFGETLQSGIVSDDKRKQEFYEIITRESERLTHLIDNVLDFSKIESGRKAFSPKEMDLGPVIASTIAAYRFHVRRLGFELTCRVPGRPVMARFDPDAISQALLNLLDNAVKYSHGNRRVKVCLSAEDGVGAVSVEDWGVGISEHEIPRIFEKFYRTRAADRTRGAGLGLTLVKHIAEVHGGTITVESRQGEGSRFTLRIPLSAASDEG